MRVQDFSTISCSNPRLSFNKKAQYEGYLRRIDKIVDRKPPVNNAPAASLLAFAHRTHDSSRQHSQSLQNERIWSENQLLLQKIMVINKRTNCNIANLQESALQKSALIAKSQESVGPSSKEGIVSRAQSFSQVENRNLGASQKSLNQTLKTEFKGQKNLSVSPFRRRLQERINAENERLASSIIKQDSILKQNNYTRMGILTKDSTENGGIKKKKRIVGQNKLPKLVRISPSKENYQ